MFFTVGRLVTFLGMSQYEPTLELEMFMVGVVTSRKEML
jgi:hypothetical protein